MTDAATKLAEEMRHAFNNWECSCATTCQCAPAQVLIGRAADTLLELARDGERLDWLESFARQSRDGLLLHTLSSTGRTGLGLTHRPLRAAIDAAMSTQEKP